MDSLPDSDHPREVDPDPSASPIPPPSSTSPASDPVAAVEAAAEQNDGNAANSSSSCGFAEPADALAAAAPADTLAESEPQGQPADSDGAGAVAPAPVPAAAAERAHTVPEPPAQVLLMDGQQPQTTTTQADAGTTNGDTAAATEAGTLVGAPEQAPETTPSMPIPATPAIGDSVAVAQTSELKIAVDVPSHASEDAMLASASPKIIRIGSAAPSPSAAGTPKAAAAMAIDLSGAVMTETQVGHADRIASAPLQARLLLPETTQKALTAPSSFSKPGGGALTLAGLALAAPIHAASVAPGRLASSEFTTLETHRSHSTGALPDRNQTVSPQAFNKSDANLTRSPDVHLFGTVELGEENDDWTLVTNTDNITFASVIQEKLHAKYKHHRPEGRHNHHNHNTNSVVSTSTQQSGSVTASEISQEDNASQRLSNPPKSSRPKSVDVAIVIDGPARDSTRSDDRSVTSSSSASSDIRLTTVGLSVPSVDHDASNAQSEEDIAALSENLLLPGSEHPHLRSFDHQKSIGGDGEDDGFGEEMPPPAPIARVHAPTWIPYHNPVLVLLTFLVPIALIVLFYNVIPLGDVDGALSDKLVWIFVVNPVTFSLFSYLNCIVFCACLDDSVPWRPLTSFIHICVGTYLGESVFFLIFYGLFESWHAMGLVALLVAMICTMGGLYFSQAIIYPQSPALYFFRLKVFLKVEICLLILMGLLTLYTIAFRVGSSSVQSILSFVLFIVTFIFKKILLSITDVFPIEISMLIAGLWMEHLDDTFAIVAYPQVENPESATFFAVAASKFIQNMAYLLFLTDVWFRFRVWIKAFLKGVFTCRGTDKSQVPIEKDDIEDRGHSNVKPGYHRRQVQFFMWKVLSQLHSCIFFLSVAPGLRFGLNNSFYPFSEHVTQAAGSVTVLTSSQFRNCLYFVTALFFMFLFSGVAGYYFIKRRIPRVFADISAIVRTVFLGPTYIGIVLMIICCNQLLAVAILQAQYRIWFWEDALDD
ncbi:hypothetical protein CAOG_07165 [Capsaspora owczarzaki ATCC 30864]|uniref:Transmembrane protein n=1 Tax=Capsaspora owczarzaki (strain ATCC 30864) TaxID=595528 RepID=A0A0D2VYT8_CAPO3|nr:hypothetical protein CAOG_07165 [Capsaspora owczarzaki ATCC 30864]KJE96917.1 hypothetical protein CAOG_007165 [Capsaspora owczarzaki ATCC 30864]|eukprot:XP_004343889.1 hypothetical protein CAOG_07165 [Capsaspora owczarzaki ATCC 30864]